MTRFTTCATLFLAFSLATFLGGQQKRESAPLLLNLNLTAVDKAGQPVSNLKAEDLQIFDNGKPAKIAWLHALPRKGPPALQSDATQTAGEYSNRTAPSASATFILMDLFNSDLSTRGNSANEVLHSLEHLESTENVYLYLLDSKARIFGIHAVGIPKGQPADDVPWTRRIKPLLDQAMRETSALKTRDDRYPSLRIQPTWQALAGMASLIAQVPGPKSFVWITEGIENGVMDPGHFLQIDTTPLRDFAANLNALEASIYSVQQRPTSLLAPDNEGTPGDTLEQLSELTGGKRFPTGSTQQAISQALRGARLVNYRIAYAPDRLDGKDHKLRIASTRKDVQIQSAQSYYAVAVPDIERRDTAIVDAIAGSPFEYPEIGLSASLTKQAGSSIRVAAHVQAPDVLFLPEAARYKASLDFELVEYGSDGRGTIAGGMPVDLDMSAEEYAKAMTAGIDIVRQAKMVDGVGRVRLIVLDRNSDLVGSVTMPIPPQ